MSEEKNLLPSELLAEDCGLCHQRHPRLMRNETCPPKTHEHFMVPVHAEDDKNEVVQVCDTCGLSAEEIQTPVIKTDCATEAKEICPMCGKTEEAHGPHWFPCALKSAALKKLRTKPTPEAAGSEYKKINKCACGFEYTGGVVHVCPLGPSGEINKLKEQLSGAWERATMDKAEIGELKDTVNRLRKKVQVAVEALEDAKYFFEQNPGGVLEQDEFDEFNPSPEDATVQNCSIGRKYVIEALAKLKGDQP